ncbi:MAG TPA: nucleoside deaminase [Ktedonobacteraceae bacterium]|nr:nucleoside deaminase [Ktedonobacteraceae bacterium]
MMKVERFCLEAAMVDRFYLEAAMKEAEDAFNQRTYPVGAVIVDPSGEIIGRGHNQVYSKGDFTSHAEVEAIRGACGKLMLEQNYEQCTLYTTYEPCIMCCGAIFHARIARVVWVKEDKDFGAFQPVWEDTEFLKKSRKYPKLRGEHAACCEELEQKMEQWMMAWDAMKNEVLGEWKSRGQ